MFDGLPYPPRDYHICPCCGTEFGTDDMRFSHAQLREMWAGNGAFWFFGNPPPDWNPWMQLINGGQAQAVPFQVGVRIEASAQGQLALFQLSCPRFSLAA
jgi:hypothetical protein